MYLAMARVAHREGYPEIGPYWEKAAFEEEKQRLLAEEPGEEERLQKKIEKLKNREKKRDPEAHSAKKGNTWHFGYKAHIGVDEESGLVHTVKATPANEHDVTVMSELLHGEEERAYGDSGYIGANKRPEAIKKNKNGKKIKYLINRRPSSIKKLSKSGQYAAKKKEH